MAGCASGKDRCCGSPGETGLVRSVSCVTRPVFIFYFWVIFHFTFLHPFPYILLGLLLQHPVTAPPSPSACVMEPLLHILCHYAFIPLTVVYALLPPDWQLLECPCPLLILIAWHLRHNMFLVD